MHRRLKILLKKAGWLLGASLLYALLCFQAGGPIIPCLFHTITGLDCPGCGVSRMCLSLLRLDFSAAFHANVALFLMLPFGVVLFLQMAVRYIKEGIFSPTKVQTAILWIMAILLLIFGVVRNL